ncbi:MAG: 30S ribosomal protein S8 [Legionellaceae bacterium]|nr:30S ribosomal protein S8 [Legionellaceae bacterium]
MTMQDPIADMLTRIRNGQAAKHQRVSLRSSKIKIGIAQVLKDEGYIQAFEQSDNDNNSKTLTIELKYYQDRPVIESIKRISRPSLRIYKACNDLIPIPGFGIAVLSTSKGVMSHLQAKKLGLGGEVICEVA